MKRLATALLMLPFLSAPASANLAACEIVITERIEDEYGGGVEIASYRPAGPFMASVYVEGETPIYEHDGHPIRGVLCTREDIVPSEMDFAIVSTGIPLVLSQNFDAPDTDTVTVFFKDGRFQHLHEGPEMAEDTAAALEARLSAFTFGDHDLAEKEAARLADQTPAPSEEPPTEPIETLNVPADNQEDAPKDGPKDVEAERLSLEDSRKFR